MRLLPEVFSYLNKGKDYSHELAMMNVQLQLQQSKSADDRATIMVQGDIDSTLALLDAQKSALEGQMQKTGFRVVDALNFLVRPLVTYFFVLLYAAAKVAMYAVAVQGDVTGWEAVLHIYDAEDRAILASILSFWFIGRVFDKKQ